MGRSVLVYAQLTKGPREAMRGHLPLVVAGAVVASGCTGRVPRHFEVPEDAKNPIEIGFRGATAAEMVDLVVQVCAQMPIGMGYIDREESYVETDWIDTSGCSRSAGISRATASSTAWSSTSSRSE